MIINYINFSKTQEKILTKLYVSTHVHSMAGENFILATGTSDLKMFQAWTSILKSVLIYTYPLDLSSINWQVIDSFSWI